jgi:hypothetical protein
MSKDEAQHAFRQAFESAELAVSLYAKPIGLGARQSIEHQGYQALSEAIREIARGLAEMSEGN